MGGNRNKRLVILRTKTDGPPFPEISHRVETIFVRLIAKVHLDGCLKRNMTNANLMNGPSAAATAVSGAPPASADGPP